MIRRGILIILFFPIIACIGQNPDFFQEEITMRIKGNHFYVTGVYHLKSAQNSKITLVYPLPSDSIYGEVDSVYIFSMALQKVIIPECKDKYKLTFTTELSDTSDQIIQISYRQKLLSNKAVYILRSTSNWGKPLKLANYHLIVPEDIQIKSFSIEPDHSINNGKEVIYYWVRYNFMPSQNLEFAF
jgi:hypothetical protein